MWRSKKKKTLLHITYWEFIHPTHQHWGLFLLSPDVTNEKRTLGILTSEIKKCLHNYSFLIKNYSGFYSFINCKTAVEFTWGYYFSSIRCHEAVMTIFHVYIEMDLSIIAGTLPSCHQLPLGPLTAFIKCSEYLQFFLIAFWVAITSWCFSAVCVGSQGTTQTLIGSAADVSIIFIYNGSFADANGNAPVARA